jgi:two-component system response regulator GlrR
MVAYKRILVVDDDTAVLFVFHETLRTLGETNEIVTAQSCLEALNEFRKEPFDLVITDLKLADMDGVQLTEAIRNLNPDTPIIWITAHGAHNYASDAARLGVASCRDKPLEIQEIVKLAVDSLTDS